MSERTALAGRIRETLAEIELVVQRATSMGIKAVQSGDDAYWDGAALNLHGFYTGLERLFEDIARSYDGSIPEGPDWHRNLLVQMSGTNANRSAVLQRSSRACLEEYLAFRHVVRNVYAFRFRPSRLKELLENLPACFSTVQSELLAFTGYLDSLEP